MLEIYSITLNFYSMELLTLSTGCDIYIHICNFVFVHRLMEVESHNRVQKYSEILWSRHCIAPEKFWSILFKFLLNNGKTVLFIYIKCPQQVYPLWWLYQRHGETDRVYLVNERSRVQTPLSSLFFYWMTITGDNFLSWRSVAIHRQQQRNSATISKGTHRQWRKYS